MLPLLLAEVVANPEPRPVPFYANPFFMFMILGLFMLTMVWLPARRQRREQEEMLAALKPGNRVVTTAGIIGTIVKIKEGEDELILRSEDTKLKVLKSSVTRILATDDVDSAK
jgi:preprotein translocase subunit YajC